MKLEEDERARHCIYFDAGWCYHPLSPEPFGCVGCANCDFCTSRLEEKMKDD